MLEPQNPSPAEPPAPVRPSPAHGGINIQADTRIDGDLVAGDKVIDRDTGDSRDTIAGDKIIDNDTGASYDEVRGNKYTYTTLLGIKIETRFLVGLIITAVVVALALWLILVPTQMPTVTKNLAIAQFGELDAGDKIVPSQQGADLSARLYSGINTFIQKTQNLPPDTKLTVWQDSMTLLQKRTPLGIVQNETQAATLAEDLQAHFIVYGYIERGDPLDTVHPFFYINHKLWSQKTGEADELIGAQEMGAPFRVQRPLNDEDLYRKLQPRANALVWFMRALGFDLVGDYALAYQTFCQANTVLFNWQDNQGREVLYYFLGREALLLGNTDAAAKKTLALPDGDWSPDCTPFQNWEQANQDAVKWFSEAKNANPLYARADFGLGQAYAQRAKNLLPRANDPGVLDDIRKNLDDAMTQYESALAKMPPSADDKNAASFVDLKTRGALGTAYTLMGYTYAREYDYQNALDNFNRAEEWLTPLLDKDAPPETETRLRAQNYLNLAATLHYRGQVYDAWRTDLINQACCTADQAQLAAQAKTVYTAALQNLTQCLALTAPTQTVDQFLLTDMRTNCTQRQTSITQALQAVP